MDDGYITGTGFAQILEAALDDLHRALTRRWREMVCRTAVEGGHFPTRFQRSVSPHAEQPVWPYWPPEAHQHLNSARECAYVHWVYSGQNGDPAAVECHGSTYTGMPSDTAPDGQMPAYVDCGMGRLLQQVEDWAWAEREALFAKLPLFDHHDMTALHDAHDAFLRLAAELGLAPPDEPPPGVPGAFAPASPDDLHSLTEQVAARDSDGQGWWTGWTGLAADLAGSGFFASVEPTLYNQSTIAGDLANLYSSRAAIIEKGRNDALSWLQWATDSLGEQELVTTDRTNGWKAVQVTGNAAAVTGAWSAAGTAIGASMVLVGFLGENIDTGSQSEEYVHDIGELMRELHDQLDTLQAELSSLERQYADEVSMLRNTVAQIHSFNLELYDFTQNTPEGDHRKHDGYEVEVDGVLRLAEFCFRAGEKYEELLPWIRRTADADPHLAGQDGDRLPSDSELLGLRDRLEGFLKTSCSRYFLAGQQMRTSARAYAETEQNIMDKFKDGIDALERQGVPESPEMQPEEHVDPTPRNRAEGVEKRDGESYVTE